MRKKIDAKIALEELLGYTKHSGKFIEEDVAPNGMSIGHWEKEEFVKGVIQKRMEEPQRLKEQSNLGERFSRRTFATFDAKRDKTAFDACSMYAKDESLMTRKRNGLVILGGYGSGKTHLAAAIINVLIDRGIPVLFGTAISHLDNIKSEFDNTKQGEYLAKMKVTPMLVIDDLGKEKHTEWTEQTWFDVINYRYEHLLPIVITTNLVDDEDCSELEAHVGGAVWSRLNEICAFIQTKGSDYRQQMQE